MKKLSTIALTLLLVCLLPLSAFAEGWVINEDTNTTKYQKADGEYAADEWQTIDGKQYYFRTTGEMAKGWVKNGSDWYYCDKETGERRYEDLATDVMTFKFDKETGVCTNFSDNVTPSVQAGWAPAHIGDAETLVNEAADGHIVYYNEQWWSTPEQVWIGLNPEVVYFHDIAGDTQPVDRNAFARIKIVEEPKADVDVDGIYDFWWLF